LSVFIVSATAILVLSMLVPEWIERHLILWRVLQAIASMAAAGTAIYTGILLASMSYIPAWTVPLMAGRRLPLIPFLFLASALSTGAVSLIVAAGVYRLVVKPDASATELSHVLETAEPLLIALEAALLILYLRRLRQAGPTAIMSADTLLRGSWRLPFWLGVVGCALALPFVLHLANVIRESEAVGLVAALSVLVGGFVLRLGILSVGIKERPPLYRLSEWRGRALDARV
jgi:formate-dependent nitrite reductase membrane component NrfD